MNRLQWIVPGLLCLLLAGCAGKVTLLYGEPGVVSPLCTGEVTVIAFNDLRTVSDLGHEEGNAAIQTDSDVADWVGWALFDELNAAGCQAKYRTSWETATGKVVTGDITEVSLDQTGTGKYRGVVKLTVTIYHDNDKVHTRNVSSEVERVVVPGIHDKGVVLSEALKGAMEELIPIIINN